MEKIVTDSTSNQSQPDLVLNGEDENIRSLLNDENVPRDAKIMTAILKTSGVVEYDPKIINQLLEFMHHYLTDLIIDADEFRQHANRNVITVDDVRLAIHSKLNHSFVQPPSRQTLLEIARSKNKLPLPDPTSKFPVNVILPKGDSMHLKLNYQVGSKTELSVKTTENTI